FIDGTSYNTFADFQKQTGLERHGGLMTTVKGIFINDFPMPSEAGQRMDPEKNLPILAPRSPAIDNGAVLPSINDGFNGRAPDIGAYEHGRQPPHYGPRPLDN